MSRLRQVSATVRARVLRSAVERPRLGRALWVLREAAQWVAALTSDRGTLSRKLQRKMRLDRRELLATFADKSAVRSYVADRVGPELLPQSYALVDRADRLDLAHLPDRFVMKPTHGSGAAVIVHPAAPSGQRLPVPARTDWWLHAVTWIRREDLDLADLTRLTDHWLSRSYLLGGRAYWDLPRRLLVEEFLADASGRLSADYRFWVFHGTVRWMQADLDWTGGLGGSEGAPRRSLHLPDWTPIDVVATRPRPDVVPARPATLEWMIEVAEALGAETDMVRVDLYDLDGRVVFGELTSYPLGGRLRFDPPEYDRILGQWWDPPRDYGKMSR